MKRRSGFTLIELLVVIAIIAILAAILFPVFAQARDKARQSMCLSNTKQVGLALSMYVQDYDESFPNVWFNYDGVGGPAYLWVSVLVPSIKNTGVWNCPSVGTAGRWYDICRTMDCDYGINSSAFYYYRRETGNVYGGTRNLAAINYPAELLFCTELSPERKNPDGSRLMGSRIGAPWVSQAHPCRTVWDYVGEPHQEGTNIVYADGHAKWMKKDAVCAENAKGNASRMWNPTAP
jgi:prepilin-type N-terminal cleavage/methylation domain-containing protein/prepilin-type processing-associated H-X9-DG protein